MKAKRFLIELIDKVRLLSRKDRESYLLLYSILGFVPNSLKPYKLAFTHSSSLNSPGRKLVCNERLEFLGDAVLSSVTADFLYTKFKKEREGFLSKSRSTLVCRDRLNALAVELGLDRLVMESGTANQHNSYVYGNALEALIGAVYIDKGYKYCRTFLLEKVFPHLGDIDAVVRNDNNYKSRLLEWGQKRRRKVVFELLKEERRADGAFFVSRVLVNGEPCGVGEGFSKRESQQAAAREAVKVLIDRRLS